MLGLAILLIGLVSGISWKSRPNTNNSSGKPETMYSVLALFVSDSKVPGLTLWAANTYFS